MTRTKSSNQRYIKTNGEDSQEIFMIEIIMIREIIKIDIGQIAEIEEYQAEVEASMDKIIEEDCITLIIIEMAIGGTISEVSKIKEVKSSEVLTEGIIEMIILEEVETDNIQVISEEMTEVVVVSLDQVQEPVVIETELDAISVGNMIILLQTVQLSQIEKE